MVYLSVGEQDGGMDGALWLCGGSGGPEDGMSGWCEEEMRVDLAADFEGEREEGREWGEWLRCWWWC